MDETIKPYDKQGVWVDVRVGLSPGMRLVFHFGDSPYGAEVVFESGVGYIQEPTILFGDPEHLSYIETDAVDLEGQPIPELPLPAAILMISVTIAMMIVRRRIRSADGS